MILLAEPEGKNTLLHRVAMQHIRAFPAAIAAVFQVITFLVSQSTE